MCSKHINTKQTAKPSTPIANPGYNYKFGGKELQSEFGVEMYDFGARNGACPERSRRDPALGRWMNVDPLAENYINISPYVYVANSPLLFTDPDGQRIIVGGEDYEYQEDRDYDAIEDDFYRDVYKALDGLYNHATITVGEGDEAKEVNIIQELIDMEFKSVEIVEGLHEFIPNDNDEYKSYIKFSSNVGIEFFTGENGEKGTNSPAGGLGHELGHAYNYNFNRIVTRARKRDISTRGKLYLNNRDVSFKDKEEEYTTKMVNPILHSLGEDQRNNYGVMFFINTDNNAKSDVFSRTKYKYLKN